MRVSGDAGIVTAEPYASSGSRLTRGLRQPQPDASGNLLSLFVSARMIVQVGTEPHLGIDLIVREPASRG